MEATTWFTKSKQDSNENKVTHTRNIIVYLLEKIEPADEHAAIPHQTTVIPIVQ